MSMTVSQSAGVKGRKLKKVTTRYWDQGGAAREPAAVTIWKSGRELTNVECGEMLIPLVTAADQDPKRVLPGAGVDDENSIVGVSVAPSGTAGAMPARPMGDDRNIGYHLGGVFQEYPHLRPVGKRQYMVTLEPDDDGLMCTTIDLKSGLLKKAGTRGAGSSSDVAAQQPGGTARR